MTYTLLGGRYELRELIGAGGMADVYLGYDQRLSREVAIKVLRSDLARDPSFVTRFRKEALAVAGINHPGIVAVYDSGEVPAPYIVMELVHGRTLREIIHQGERLPLKRALEIAEGILAALEYSHERGIVHRDIKPANVMITEKGDVKVMDFGIARAMDDAAATLTSTWNIVGTAQYLSPEQAVGDAADIRSDIYSTGCLLFELLTGQPPFTGETPVSIAYQHASSPAPLVRTINSELPEGVEVMLAVALAKSPDDRYQSAGLMLDDVYRIRDGEEVTTQMPKIVLNKKKTISAIVAGVLAISVIAGGAVVLSRNSAVVVGAGIPNVVGLTESDAQAMLGDYVVTIQHAHDARIPVGRVASQFPLATTAVKKGSGVLLTISDGPGDAMVPTDLVGKSLIDARASLAAVGLVISSITARASDQPQGTVLEVNPIPGSTITAGTGVTLVIASGQVEVPNLIGVEVIQARTLLVQAGFLIKEFYDYDASQPAGVVIRQAPDAGTTQTIGQSVTITINKSN